MPRPLIKICGLTNLADLRLADRLGADYLGLIVELPRSPRNLSAEAAEELRQEAGDKAVLVTEGLSRARLVELAEALRPCAIQLHGDDSPEFVAALVQELPPGIEVWKTLGIPPQAEEIEPAAADILLQAAEYASAGGTILVLDTRIPAGSGGTGIVSDWVLAARLVAQAKLPVLLAGGIGPDNLLQAWNAVHPAGFDLSSRLEERPGVKSPTLLQQLFRLLPG